MVQPDGRRPAPFCGHHTRPVLVTLHDLVWVKAGPVQRVLVADSRSQRQGERRPEPSVSVRGQRGRAVTTETRGHFREGPGQRGKQRPVKGQSTGGGGATLRGAGVRERPAASRRGDGRVLGRDRPPRRPRGGLAVSRRRRDGQGPRSGQGGSALLPSGVSLQDGVSKAPNPLNTAQAGETDPPKGPDPCPACLLSVGPNCSQGPAGHVSPTARGPGRSEEGPRQLPAWQGPVGRSDAAPGRAGPAWGGKEEVVPVCSSGHRTPAPRAGRRGPLPAQAVNGDQSWGGRGGSPKPRPLSTHEDAFPSSGCGRGHAGPVSSARPRPRRPGDAEAAAGDREGEWGGGPRTRDFSQKVPGELPQPGHRPETINQVRADRPRGPRKPAAPGGPTGAGGGAPRGRCSGVGGTGDPNTLLSARPCSEGLISTPPWTAQVLLELSGSTR